MYSNPTKNDYLDLEAPNSNTPISDDIIKQVRIGFLKKYIHYYLFSFVLLGL